MALTVCDASVLIAVLNPADAHHEAAVGALDEHAESDLRIPAHTLAETLVHPARVGKVTEARRFIDSLEIKIDPVTEQTAVAAARLRAQHGSALRMPDALVLAYAEVQNADCVLTADARWQAWSDRVHLLTPGKN